MNCLSLLFASATQGTPNSCGTSSTIPPSSMTAGSPARPVSEAVHSASEHRGGGLDDYLLPSGIASMEHWLDLNG
jgi:hypothetical protein